MFCARLFICALWSPAGKGLTSWLSFVVSSVSLSLSHWYPESGVVLDCIDSWSLHHYLLSIRLDAGWYVLIRFAALGCDKITIVHFLMTRSVTIGSLLQIQWDTFRHDCPDRVHHEMQTWKDHQDRVPDLGRCRTRINVLMRSSGTDTLCCDRIRLLFRCLLRSQSRIPTIWPEGYINTARLTIDYIVSFTISYRVNVSTHNPW